MDPSDDEKNQQYRIEFTTPEEATSIPPTSDPPSNHTNCSICGNTYKSRGMELHTRACKIKASTTHTKEHTSKYLGKEVNFFIVFLKMIISTFIFFKDKFKG